MTSLGRALPARRALVAAALVVSAFSAEAAGAELPPRLERGPYLQLGTHESVVVRFRTDRPCRGVVEVLGGPGAAVFEEAKPVTDHEIAVSGLQPGTRYDYSVSYRLDDGGARELTPPDRRPWFRTAPPPGEARPTRVWVVGDSGTADANARAVRDAFLRFTGRRAPDLWLMLGDNAYNSGTDAEYQHAVFRDMYEDILARSVLWPTLGNHDARSADSATQSGAYYDIFTLPTAGEAGGAASGTEAYYSFDFGDLHFICLDSADSDRRPGSPMLRWLEQDLAEAAARWIVAFWHHPPYSKGSHDSDYEVELVEMRRFALPILERGGTDLVLTGHSHSYERSVLLKGHFGTSFTLQSEHIVDGGDGRVAGDGAYALDPERGGSVYVVAGASGKISGGSLDHPVMVASFNLLGSVVLDVHGPQLDLRYVTSHGEVKDHVTLVEAGSRARALSIRPIGPRSSWRFHTREPPPGWTAPGFDDAEWTEGQAPLGFGEPYLETDVRDGPSRPDRVYVRRRFDVAHAEPEIESLRLHVLIDDAFTAWLNGVEVARLGVPRGPLAAILPVASHEARRYELIPLGRARPLLRPQGNVLAVEVRNASSDSRDLVFDAWIDYDAYSDPER